METKTINDILTMDVLELNCYLMDTFACSIPEKMETVEDMDNLSNLLMLFANQYSYLMSCLSYLKIYTKNMKQNNLKDEAAEMMMRRDSFQMAVDIVKQKYAAVSRVITVKQEINREMSMY